MRWKYSVFILLAIVVLFSCDEEPNIIEPITSQIIRGPYLGNVTKTSIVVSWETIGHSDGVVEYATADQYIASEGAYDQKTRGSEDVKNHNVTLKDLAPSTLYHYRVVSGIDRSKDSTFHTAVEPSEPFTLAVYGDTRTNPLDHLAVVNRIIEHEPNLVLNTGDLVTYGHLLSLWDAFFYITRDLMRNVPYYPVLGNHEDNAQYYYDFFHLPEGGGKENEQWYSFDYGNTHFVGLDSNVIDSQEQLAWLESDLAQAAGKAQWIFVTFHHAAYSSGEHGSKYGSMPKWIEAFERYGVDVVFNGHDHLYERSSSNGIWYIVTGSGGAPQYDVNQRPNPAQVYAEKTLHFCKLRVDGARIDFEMIRDDGTVGDTMTMTAPVVAAVPASGT